jgi:hypothetical protein
MKRRTEVELHAKLARALATSLSDADALLLLYELLETTPDDACFVEALTSLLRRGHGSARDRARDTLRSDTRPARREGAAVMLAITGQHDDLDLLLSVTPTPATLRALGRFGHVGSIDRLIELLADDTLAEAAGEALDRITAGGLRHVVEEPWDLGIPAELEAEAERLAGPMPTRKVEKVILDAAAWRKWSTDNRGRFDPTQKYRAGVPFEPVHIVDELSSAATPPSRRDEAACELACTLGARLTFRTDDWVVQQRAHLEELRRLALGACETPGSWVFAGAGSRGGYARGFG